MNWPEGFAIESECCDSRELTGDLYIQPDGFGEYVRSDSDSAATSHPWRTNPAIGQPWTVAEVNGLEAGFRKYESNTTVDSETRVTQLYVTVTFRGSSYAYNDGPNGTNDLLSIPGAGAATFTYSARGELATKTVVGVTWTYGYNGNSLLEGVNENATVRPTYTYDGLGRRVKVDGTSSATWTVSIVSEMDVIYEKDNANAVTKYVYANGMRIAKITSTGAVQYYLGDHLGSTRKVLDASRATVFSTEYEPFGKPYSVTGSEPYKYTMEKHDDPTGFVYLRARQYDPEIGRFVSADPVLGRLGSPQTLNRYSYVVNNPLKYTDPSGLLFISPWLSKDCGTFLECEASFRSGTDITMMGIGFIPGADTISDAYFLFWSTVDLIRAPSWERGGWIALDFGSLLVPGASFGTWARTGKVGANVLLPFLAGIFRRADNVPLNRIDDIPPATRFPRSVNEMDGILGVPGRRIPDVPGAHPPGTPGRGKSVWDFGTGKSKVSISGEAHDYLPGHRPGLHWHVVVPGHSRKVFYTDEAFPSYLTEALRRFGANL